MKLPQDETAERAVLGALFLKPELLPLVEQIIPLPECFEFSKHQPIYLALQNLTRQRRPVDWVTAVSELVRLGEITRFGGQVQAEDFLADLTRSVPGVEALEEYARAVRDLWIRRMLVAKLREAEFSSGDPKVGVLELLGKVQAESNLLVAQADYKPPKEVGDIVETVLEEFVDRKTQKSSKLQGIPLGWDHLDRVTMGAEPGQVIVIGGRPGDGKTSFALNLGDNMARGAESRCGDGRGGVHMVSLEMFDRQIGRKLISAEARLDSARLRLADTTPEQDVQIERAVARIVGRRFWIDDSHGLTFPQIRARFMLQRERQGVEILIVDYLQKITKRDRRIGQTDHVSETVQDLKTLAKELRVVIILLAQLNRGIEGRRATKGSGGSPRPVLSDLRDSGFIEQEADVVILLHPRRAEAKNNIVPTDLIVAKNREGKGETTIAMDFHKDTGRFEIAAPREAAINAADFKNYHEREAAAPGLPAPNQAGSSS